MAVLNPDHLFDQADKLIARRAAGPPRQVDLRRAISAAYYGTFHCVLTAAADQIVGSNRRAGNLYKLVYRSIDHRALRDLCDEVTKQTFTFKYREYAPTNGFEPKIKAFASAVLELKAKRDSADYDPSIRISMLDATVAIATARVAVDRFQGASGTQKRTFLTLLLFPPRSG